MDAHEPRVVLVTGATGAIGEAVARRLAEDDRYEVVLACRDEGKAARTVASIRRMTGNERVRYELVNLSRRSSIGALAARWRGPLHVLLNNAAATPRRRHETPEGLELQFATNVMGYFWMIQAFTEVLKRSAPSRVVNVASYWAGGLELDDLQFERRSYDNDAAYRQSKQANRMLTVAFAQRLQQAKVTVNACHPGDVSSQLSRNLGFGGHETPDEGAKTPVWLATRELEQELTGKYFERLRESRCRFVVDPKAVERLYDACARYGF